MQGGSNVVAKRVSRVGLHFEDGQYRASTTGAATSQVLRSAATLPEDIRRQITRERRAGDPDAAIDPMADPAVRAAVERARFELLRRLRADPGAAALQRDALIADPSVDSTLTRPTPSRASAVAGGVSRRMDARESVARLEPDAAEGATAPESLRQKDRADRTLWKASAVAEAMAGHRRGNPP